MCIAERVLAQAAQVGKYYHIFDITRTAVFMKTPKWKLPIPPGSVSILISVVGVAISSAALYFSQIRYRSVLVAQISTHSLSTSDMKLEATGTTFKFGATATIALANSGNAPASLLRLFWVVPLSMKFDCATPTKDFDNPDVLSSAGYYSRAYQAVPFSLEPAVVPPSGIAIVKAELPERNVWRGTDQFGDKTACLLFVAMGYTGKLHFISVPAYTIIIHKTGVGTKALLSKPIDLIH